MTLRANDLKDMMYYVFEVDSYASKMGDDANIVTLSFSLKQKQPADDLVKFIESGYPFVLDADVTAGEQRDGTYKVFVEIERNKNIAQQVTEVLDGVQKLAGNEKLRFRYYKNFKSLDATYENLEETIPKSSEDYGIKKDQTLTDNFQHFFNRSYIDSVDLVEHTLTIKKAYADPLSFDVVNFGSKNDILENIEGKFDLMESYPEILFLTKYIGDYNISKYGDSLVFENEDKALVLKRI